MEKPLHYLNLQDRLTLTPGLSDSTYEGYFYSLNLGTDGYKLNFVYTVDSGTRLQGIDWLPPSPVLPPCSYIHFSSPSQQVCSSSSLSLNWLYS